MRSTATSKSLCLNSPIFLTEDLSQKHGTQTSTHQILGAFADSDYLLLGKYLQLRPQIQKPTELALLYLFLSEQSFILGQNMFFPK